MFLHHQFLLEYSLHNFWSSLKKSYSHSIESSRKHFSLEKWYCMLKIVFIKSSSDHKYSWTIKKYRLLSHVTSYYFPLNFWCKQGSLQNMIFYIWKYSSSFKVWKIDNTFMIFDFWLFVLNSLYIHFIMHDVF